jgi:hypothetical protein
VTLSVVLFAFLFPTGHGTPRGSSVLFAADFGPVVVHNYATNGQTEFLLQEQSDGRSGPARFGQIRFQAWGNTVEFNCGWVVYFPKGLDLSACTRLRFKIRGERGDEKVIVKAKDANGRERARELAGVRFLPREGRITTEWQDAIVPFEEFGDVRFNRIDNVSLASNGQLNGISPQNIRVGEFKFDK